MGWDSWNGDEVMNIVNTNFRSSINATLETILTVSQSEVPLDEGPLQHSGVVVMASGNKPAGAVCYGGGTGTGRSIIPYAIKWHEKNANFQKGRKRFYLRDPFQRLALRELERNIGRIF